MKFQFICKASLMALMAVGIGLTGCSSESDKKDETKEEKPSVKVQQVSETAVDQIATFTGTTEADVINNISAQMSNRIKQILVDEGQRVSRGQRLVVLDGVNTDTYRIQLATAEANMRNIKVDYDRAVELYNIGGGTKQMVDQLHTQLINAQNGVANAKRVLQNAQENTVLTSPISGVVTVRNYDPGDMTGALPILTIAQVQPIKIVINVSENDYSKVKLGMPARLSFETYGDEVFDGKVSLIAPTVDQKSRSFEVEITLPNGNNKILPGMFARVTLNLGTAQRVVVPDRAVVKQPGSGNYYVYVYENGKVSYNKVELGQRIGDSYELISGVAPGSQVVIVGQAALSNGKAVQLIK